MKGERSPLGRELTPCLPNTDTNTGVNTDTNTDTNTNTDANTDTNTDTKQVQKLIQLQIEIQIQIQIQIKHRKDCETALLAKKGFIKSQPLLSVSNCLKFGKKSEM